MNKRQIKKKAKNFMDRGIVAFPGYYVTRYPRTDGTVAITEYIPNSVRLYREICDIAHRYGWEDGCHWDSPFIVDILVLEDGVWKKY